MDERKIIEMYPDESKNIRKGIKRKKRMKLEDADHKGAIIIIFIVIIIVCIAFIVGVAITLVKILLWSVDKVGVLDTLLYTSLGIFLTIGLRYIYNKTKTP